MKLIVASWRQFLLVLVPVVCLFVLMVALAGDSYGELTAWYWGRVRGLRYERLMGFTTGTLNPPSGWWGITTVAPGGAFWRAGLRVGDVPVRLPVRFSNGELRVVPVWYGSRNGVVSSFYSFLARSEGRGPVKFSVCSVDELYSHGGPACPGREVTISVPAD
jgi:hypothetical protein